MNPLSTLIDLLLTFVHSERASFWVLVAFIVVGLIAVVANMMEPSRASF